MRTPDKRFIRTSRMETGCSKVGLIFGGGGSRPGSFSFSGGFMLVRIFHGFFVGIATVAGIGIAFSILMGVVSLVRTKYGF